MFHTTVTCAFPVHQNTHVPKTLYVPVPFTTILHPVLPLLQLYSVPPFAVNVTLHTLQLNGALPLIFIVNHEQIHGSSPSHVQLLLTSIQHVPHINSSHGAHPSHVHTQLVV